jgi:hypothetical protein
VTFPLSGATLGLIRAPHFTVVKKQPVDRISETGYFFRPPFGQQNSPDGAEMIEGVVQLCSTESIKTSPVRSL